MKGIILLIISLFTFQAHTIAQDVNQLLTDAKKLQDQYKEALALQKFELILKKEPNNKEALQHTSYLLSIEGDRKKTTEEKKIYFNNAKKFAEQALKLDNTDAENHYNLALALGRISMISSSEEKLKYAKQIKAEAEIAIKLDPKHAASYHMLGRLNREIANMSSIKVMAAKALYGGVPENCTFEKAEGYFNKAIQFRSNYILYYYDAAVNADYNNKKSEAKKLLEKAIALPMLTPDDPYRIQDCKALLKKLSN